MIPQLPLWASQQTMASFNTRITVYHAERIPQNNPVVIVSNHRSFLDPALLMVALNQPIRFACHRYMVQVPVLSELVGHMGGFALDAPRKGDGGKTQALVEKASQFLSVGDVVGIFPEGAQPMVHQTEPDCLGRFHRGFAHLLLRSPLPEVTILPVAIASRRESTHSAFPVRLLHWFDPSEPLFDQNGWHPLVVYHTVNVMIGEPVTITASDRHGYQGRQGRILSHHVTQQCQNDVHQLLQQGLRL